MLTKILLDQAIQLLLDKKAMLFDPFPECGLEPRLLIRERETMYLYKRINKEYVLETHYTTGLIYSNDKI